MRRGRTARFVLVSRTASGTLPVFGSINVYKGLEPATDFMVSRRH